MGPSLGGGLSLPERFPGLARLASGLQGKEPPFLGGQIIPISLVTLSFFLGANTNSISKGVTRGVPIYPFFGGPF